MELQHTAPDLIALAVRLHGRLEAHDRLLPAAWRAAADRAHRDGDLETLAHLLRIELAPAEIEALVVLVRAAEYADEWMDDARLGQHLVGRFEVATAVRLHAGVVLPFVVP